MKKNILLFICSLMLSGHIINAQITQQQSIEDSVFGWLKVYHLKGVKETKKTDNRVFSIAQLSVCDSLVNWMQALRKVCLFRGHWCQHNETQNYSGVAEGQKECNEKAGDEFARIKKQTSSGRYSIKNKTPQIIDLAGFKKKLS